MSDHLLLVFFSFVFSFSDVGSDKVSPPHPSFPYQLEQPNAIFELPESLKEISGLTLSLDSTSLAAVNDEEGIVFLLDKKNGKIIKEIDFWEGGDYEGVEIVGADAYVVKSSGTIYQIKDYASDSSQTNKIKSFLNKENDVEGLAYDPLKNTLLVGCKGKITEGEIYETAFKKAIYEFDLESMAMKSRPAFLLTLPDIQDYLDHLANHGTVEKLLEDFSKDQTELKFSPSGIAVHPITQEVYVTSSKGKLLLVLTPEGKIKHLVKLKKKIHRQPEGICFDSDGTLYIANEGKDDKAIIYKFLYHN